MTDFIESLEDDFGFYQKDENFYKIIDEDLFKYNFLVIGVEKKECSLLWLLDGDQDNLETLARTLEVAVKITSEQIKHFSNLAKKFDKKLLGLSKVDKKHDKYWLVECNICCPRWKACHSCELRSCAPPPPCQGASTQPPTAWKSSCATSRGSARALRAAPCSVLSSVLTSCTSP